MTQAMPNRDRRNVSLRTMKYVPGNDPCNVWSRPTQCMVATHAMPGPELSTNIILGASPGAVIGGVQSLLRSLPEGRRGPAAPHDVLGAQHELGHPIQILTRALHCVATWENN
jgi:hypothetical protein